MNEGALEGWLLAVVGDADQRRSGALASERLAIEQLENELAHLSDPTDWAAELNRLKSEEASIDRESDRWKARLALLHRRFIQQIGDLLEECRDWIGPTVLEDTQALFDSEEPHLLHEPIETSSVAMLEADLRRSQLPEILEDLFRREIVEAAEEIGWAQSTLDQLEAVKARRDLLRAEVEDLRKHFLRHNVSEHVLRSLEAVEEPERFVEDVIRPCLCAAAAESEWHLPRGILEELRCG
jgi:hypothetical protein